MLFAFIQRFNSPLTSPIQKEEASRRKRRKRKNPEESQTCTKHLALSGLNTACITGKGKKIINEKTEINSINALKVVKLQKP